MRKFLLHVLLLLGAFTSFANSSLSGMENTENSKWCYPTVKFKNTGCQAVKIYKKSGSNLYFYKTLNAGSYYNQSTTYGHQWVFKVNGNYIGNYIVSNCNYHTYEIETGGCGGNTGGDCGSVPNYLSGLIYMGEYNNSKYFCSNSNDNNWNEASANNAATQLGGHLVAINNAGENEFVRNGIMANQVWIGLTDAVSEGDFKWVNGEPLSYTNWSYGEPNDQGLSSYGADHVILDKSSGKWKDRTGSDDYEFVIEVPCQAQPVCNGEITGLKIFNIGGGANIDLTDGATFLLADLPSQFNMEAMVSGNIESVKFFLSGALNGTHNENVTPYRYGGDNTPLALVPGSYTLTVKGYSQDNSGGEKCSEKTVHFTIIDTVCDGDITGLKFFNLGGGNSIGLNDGATYQLNQLPGQFNIEAMVTGNMESVKFFLSGALNGTHNENVTPYRYGGDNTPLALVPGSYTLTVKGYSQDNSGGEKCAEKTVHFTISNDPPACTATCNREVSAITACNGNGPYTIYLENANGGNYFNGGNQTWEECDNGTVHYFGTATKSMGSTNDNYITFDLYFSGKTTSAPAGSPKENACFGYDASTFVYYPVTSGTITSPNHGTIYVTRKGPSFQMGLGANHQSADFGASGWLDFLSGAGYYLTGDVNLKLSTGCGPCALLGGDSDGDGVCDQEDCFPNDPTLPATPGTACNDNDPTTVDDEILADGCTCAGTFDPCALLGGDSDGDGVCDQEDCFPNDPTLPAAPGTACNDNDPLTENDRIQADGCSCAGAPFFTLINEAFEACVTDQICGDVSSNDFVSFAGKYEVILQPTIGTLTLNQDGTFCYKSDVLGPDEFRYQVCYFDGVDANPVICKTGISTVLVKDCSPCALLGGDSDGDGVCDQEDCFPNDPTLPTAPATACNDGDPMTVSDVIQADGCSCAGIFDPCALLSGDTDGDGVCDLQDCFPYDPTLPTLPGKACDDGDPNTTFDVIQADGCSCAGVVVPVCDNVQIGGTIGFLNSCSPTIVHCKDDGDAPLIRDCISPIGGAGDLEIVWLKSTTSCLPPTTTFDNIENDPHWVMIQGADGLDFAPGNLTESTCFLRCSRRANCGVFIESNIIRVEVSCDLDVDCNLLDITAKVGQVVVSGLDQAPKASVQVFSTDYSVTYFNCPNTGDCTIPTQVIDLAEGDYIVYVKLYDGAFNLICEKYGTYTVPPCQNVEIGGYIGFGDCLGSYVYCPLTDPVVPTINNCADPEGGVGDLEIVWLSSTSSCLPPTTTFENIANDPHWVMIPGENGLSYTPTDVTQNTCYLRCVRRQGCGVFIESNIISLTIDTDCLTFDRGSVSIGDRVWDDLNGDGIQDEDEPGIENVWINLQDGDGNSLLWTNTDEDGHYIFFNQPAGDYQLLFSTPAGYEVTLAGVGTAGVDKDSDVNPLSGRTAIFSLLEGDHPRDIDGGFRAAGVFLRADSQDFDFQAVKGDEHTELYWTHNKGENVNAYSIERSVNGGIFTEISAQPSKGGHSAEVYLDYDLAPATGDNKYRVKLNHTDGSVTYSDPILVHFADLVDFTLFPNPASDFLKVDLETLVGKAVQIQIVNNMGSFVKSIQIEEVYGKYYQIDLRDLKEGHYAVWVLPAGHKAIAKQLVIGKP